MFNKDQIISPGHILEDSQTLIEKLLFSLETETAEENLSRIFPHP